MSDVPGLPPASDANLPILEEFADASCHGERADMLLKMPLYLVARDCLALTRTCAATGFEGGLLYCELVTAALHSRRGPDGGFRGDIADQVATAGAALQDLANQWRPVTDEDGICRALEECTCAPTRAAREKCPSWRFTR
ncbi:hypothetical protein [Oricola indica]|jgi:hypothetical protein|uniref:hypothetical protein n=1 Tax=Oricola indica TaxID=2872591 RepID=UPI001CC03A62|nr:hypothetical protein [Oricola indica]